MAVATFEDIWQEKKVPSFEDLWKSKGTDGLGFDPEGTGYDDATAKKYGYKPTLGVDGKMHMQSRSPETGLLLKGRKHETWDLLEKGEKEAGYEIYKGEDGRYYSKPDKKSPESFVGPPYAAAGEIRPLPAPPPVEGIRPIADPNDITLQVAPTPTVAPVKRPKQTIGAMVPFGMPPGSGFGDPLGLSEITTAIREMVAPTTPYTEKEATKAYKEIPRTLENVGVRALTLGGLAGPLMGLKPSELRAALDEDIRDSAGFGEALAPALGETTLLAVEWGYLYPKLFKAVGAAPRLIAKIPGVSKGAKALKSLGGIEKLATKYPRLYNRVSKVLGAFTKGATVGTITALPEALGEELPAGEVLKHTGKSAAIMGGIATTFQVLSQVDTARYVKQLRNSLIKASNQRFTAKIAELKSTLAPRQVNEAMKSLTNAKRLELQQIDNIVSGAEAQLIGLKSGKLYQKGQGMVESPQQAADRFIRQGIGTGKAFKGEPLLKKGLGQAKPFIEMPTTRAGEVRESLAEAAKVARHPVEAARKAVARRPSVPAVPKAVTPPPVVPGASAAEVSPEKRTQAIDFVRKVLGQEKYAALDEKAKIEIGQRMLAEQGVEVTAEELTKTPALAEAPAKKGLRFEIPKQEPVTPKPDKTAQFKDMSTQELRTLIDTTEDPELQRLAHNELRGRPETPATVPIPEPQPSIQPRKPAEAVEIPQKAAEAKPEAVEVVPRTDQIDEFNKTATPEERVDALKEIERRYSSLRNALIGKVPMPSVQEIQETAPSMPVNSPAHLDLMAGFLEDAQSKVEKLSDADKAKLLEDPFIRSWIPLKEKAKQITQPPTKAKAEVAKVEKEIEDVEKEAITEPAESPKVDTGQAGKIIPTGKLDPTNPKEALEITRLHAQSGEVGVGGIFEQRYDREKEIWVITSIEYTSKQIDTAYRTIQKPVESPMPDTDLFAMPGKETQMKAIAEKMAKVKGVVRPKKAGPKPLTKPTALPKAKTKIEDHIKAVYMASAGETERYAINGVNVEGDIIIATDGRRMFWAKGKWGKDGIYLDAAALKKGSLGKLAKEKINFPKWQDIVPDVSDQKPIHVPSGGVYEDLDTVLRRVRQAASITTEESRGITVIENKDGSLGFAAAAPEVGHVEINVNPGGKILGAVRPSFLMDVIKYHAIRGDRAFEFYFSDPTRPILTKSLDGKTSTLTMPINPGEPTEAIKKAVEQEFPKAKPPETSIGAAAAGFTTQNPALQRALKLAKKNGKDYYVVQGATGKYAVRKVRPKKGDYTVVNPSGEMNFVKQASVTAEDAFDFGEAVRRQEKFDNKLDEFKAKLNKKNADVKAIQDELFQMVKASGMSPAKVKSVVGLLRNIRADRHQKTNLKVLMKAIARASEYTGQENRRILRREILKLLKKTKPKKTHGRLKGKFTPEVQRRLDYLRKNILRRRAGVLAEMAVNIERVEQGQLEPYEMLEVNMLLNLTGLRGMSFKEMANSYQNIKKLIEQGKLIHDAKIEQMKQLKEQRKERFLNILTGGKGLKEGAESLPERETEKRPVWLNKLNRASSAWDNIMDYLSRFDKTSKPYESDLSKFGDKVHLSEYSEAKGVEKHSQQIHNGFAEVFGTESPSEMWKIIHGLAKRDVDLGTFTDAIGRKIVWKKLSKLELIKRYMELQDPTLQETFEGRTTEDGRQFGMHWTQEMRDAVLNNLSAKEKAWGDWQLQFYREYYPSINEIYNQQYFIDLPKNEYYSPINRTVEGDYAEETLLFKEVIRHASVTNPSLITRIKNMNPLRWTDANKVLMNHMVRMEHFKTWAQTMHELRSIFSDKDVRKAIRQYHGKHILDRIDKELDEFARGGINQMLVNNWIDRLRRNFTSAALARPAIAPKQIPSILSYLTEMPLPDFVTGITKFWMHPIRNTRFLMKESPVFKESVKGGYERDVRLVMNKGVDYKIAHHRSFRELLFTHIRLGDYLARAPGQYAKWLSAKKKMNAEAAMREAEKTTGRTQPGWKLSQLSAPQKGGSVWKLFTMFQTQPIRYYNIAVDNARNAAYGRGSRLKALANLALIWVILPMLFNWIADAFQWKKKHQMVAVALGPFGYIPIAGKLITNIALAVVGEAYGTQLSPIQSIPERFKRAASAARRLFKNRRDATKDTTVKDAIRLTEEMAEGIGYATGLPTPYIVQAERSVRKIVSKDDAGRKERLPGWRAHPAAELVFSPYALRAEEPLMGLTLKELRKKRRDWTYDNSGRSSDGTYHLVGDPVKGKTQADIDRIKKIIRKKIQQKIQQER